MAPYTLSYRPSVDVNNLKYVSEGILKAEKVYLEAFGSPDSNLFYLEGMDFLSVEGINFLHQLSQDVAKKIPYLKESYSVINLFPPSTALPLTVGTEEAEKNQKWLLQRALTSPVTASHIVSEDGRKVLVILDFMPLLSKEQLRQTGKEGESPYLSIGRAMAQILQDYQQERWSKKGLRIWGSGAAHIVYQQFLFYVSDLSKIFILLLIVMLLLIFLMLRSWLAFWGTLLSSIIANWFTIGIMGILGQAVDLTFLMIPVTIGVATAIGYSVHFYNHFKHSLQHTSVDTALAIAWLRCSRPMTFTALTTMFSFLSLCLVPIPAIQSTGYASFLEVLIIYILTMTLFPLLLSFTHFRANYRAIIAHSKWELSRQLEVLARLSNRFRKSIILLSAATFFLALYYVVGLRVNYKFSEFMGSNNQVVKDILYLENSEFAPVGTVSIIIYNEEGLFPQTQERQSIARLQELQQLFQEMSEEAIVKQVYWLGDLLEDAALLRGQQTGIASIRSLSQLNGLMMLIPRLSGFSGESWLSKDRKSLRVLLEVGAFESLPLVNLVERYQSRIEDLLPGGIVFFTGFIMDTSRGDLLMSKSFIKSIIVSILIIFSLLLLIFRRLYVTLISLIPNIFPIVIIGGLISFLDINLNSFNFLMFPMVIGLIVDDTIHFFYTVVRRFDSSKNYKASIHVTLAQVGPALVETTIILCSTFAVFLFSQFQGMVHMGLFTVLVILIALVADLVLGPIFLSLVPTECLRHKPLRIFTFGRPKVELCKLPKKPSHTRK